MADKKGRSEERTDFFGNKYTQHYDEHGNKAGRSEERTGFLGGKYVQHYDQSGAKAGRSEDRAGFLGNTYTQHYDQSGGKTGRSEIRSRLLGDTYTQHHDQAGSKTGWSERKSGFFGKRFTQHYGHAAPGTSPGGMQSTSGSTASFAGGYPSVVRPTKRSFVARSHLGRLFGFIYWAAVVWFWGWYLYLGFRYNGQQRALDSLQHSLLPLWSPTGDPVLNFLIDALMVLAGLALVPGILAGGLVLIAIVLALAAASVVGMLLVSLAQVSITGEILATAIGAAIVLLLGRSALRRFRRRARG